MFFCCECCVLSGRGLCDELITRPEEFYRLWCVVASDLETSWMRRPWPTGGAVAPKTNKKQSNCNFKVRRRLRKALLLRASSLWNSQIFRFACLSYASSVGLCEFVRCAPAPMLRHAIGINERAENKSLWKITLGFVASINVNMKKVQNSHNVKHLKNV